MSPVRVTTEADLERMIGKRSDGGAQQKALSRSQQLSAALKQQIELAGLGPVELEHKFHATRKWRLDVVVPAKKVAVEIEGGVFLKAGGGRHNRGPGMRNDMEKYAEAVIAGWRLIRVLPEWIKNGRALDYVRRAIEGGADGQ